VRTHEFETGGLAIPALLVVIVATVGVTSCVSYVAGLRWSNDVVEGDSDTPFSVGDRMRFEVESDLPGNGEYRWDFGDGTTATGRTVEHTWEEEGSYKVTVDSRFGTLTAPRLGVANITSITGTSPLSLAQGDEEPNRTSVHRMQVVEGSERVKIRLQFSQDGFPNRYEFELRAANGTKVAGGCCASEMFIELEDGLDPGGYELHVWTERGGPATSYSGTISLLYVKPI
jgi:hypothetical protein